MIAEKSGSRGAIIHIFCYVCVKYILKSTGKISGEVCIAYFLYFVYTVHLKINPGFRNCFVYHVMLPSCRS